MKLPIILFNINKNQIPRYYKTNRNSFYFYSYNNFTVEIVEPVEDDGTLLYSVKLVTDPTPVLVKTNGRLLSDNFGYTLYIPNNKTSVKLKLTTETETLYYVIALELDNIIDTTNAHYLDFLTNYKLPNIDEIKPALTENTTDQELLKRLLLDFREIKKYFGTKESISRILQFIGLPKESLTIFEEYLNNSNPLNNNAITIRPNKKLDTKTGNYHVLFDNYTGDDLNELDDNNLPIREFIIEDLDTFIESLLYGIELANNYFTLKEQDITFFGMNYSSNIALEPGMTSNMSMIFENDIYDFRKDISINAYTHIDSANIDSKIYNKKLIQKLLYRTEVKAYREINTPTSNLIYFIDDEIFDDQLDDITPEMLDNVDRSFGIILHLEITSPETFIEFTLIDKINPLYRLTYNKAIVDESGHEHFQIIILNSSTYDLEIQITDKYNNKEKYFYELQISNNIQRIDFETFNSVGLTSNQPNDKNDITLDVDTPNIVPAGANYYILKQSAVPVDMSEYYNVGTGNVLTWLRNTKQYMLPEMEKNNVLDDITDNLSLYLQEAWIEILSFEYEENVELRLKIFDVNLGEYVNIRLEDIGNYPDYAEVFDCLYVTVLDVYDDEEAALADDSTPWYLIMTTETGINITRETFNFVLIDTNTGLEVSIHDLVENETLFKKRLPVNYDFPLVTRENSVGFVPYVSDCLFKETIEDVEFNMVRSPFTRLINIEESTDADIYNVMLDDIILCRLNDKYVVDQENVNWKIYDHFSGKILYESNEYILKFRIPKNTIFNINCSFNIDNETYNIFKKGILSSFQINL